MNMRKKFYYSYIFSFLVILLFFVIECTEKGNLNPLDSIQNRMLFFSSFSISKTELKIGGEEAIVKAYLVDGKGAKVVNQKVLFFTSAILNSYITSYAFTDTSGSISIKYTTGSASGNDTIVALSYDADNKPVRDSLYIMIKAFANIKLSATKSFVYADGVSGTEITAELIDINNSPIVGKTINFSATVGTIENSKVTDNLGKATVVFTGIASSTDVNSIITASIQSDVLGKRANISNSADLIGDTLQVSLKGIIIEINSNPSTIVADGVSKSTITARLTTTLGEFLSSKTISFSTNLGSLSSNSAITDSAGIAKVNLTSPTTTGQATVTATYGKTITRDSYVNFAEVPPQEPAFIRLSYDLTTLQVGEGNSTISIVAIVSDFNGNPVVDGTSVKFSTLPLPGIIISSPIGTVGGTATSTLKYPTSAVGTEITIFARSGSIADSVSLTLPGVAGEVSEIQVFPQDTKGEILADGFSSLTIVALLLDSKGEPVPGKVVNFEVENGLGMITKASVSEALTDAAGNDNPDKGKAFATLTSIADTVDVFPRVKAISSGKVGYSESGEIVFRGISMKVSSVKDTIRIGEQVQINVSLKEKTSTIAIDNAEVTFGTSLGSIEKTRTTDNSGLASNILLSGNTPGTAVVTINFGKTITKRINVEIIKDAPASISLASDKSSILADGLSTCNLTATVFDIFRNPMSGTEVNFLVNSNGTISPVKVISDANGIARTVCTSVGNYYNLDAEITARAGTVSSNRVTIQLRGITFGLKPNLTVTPYSVVANGMKKTVIIAELKETVGTGAPLDTGTVYFSTDKGRITPSSRITNGIATALLTSPDQIADNVIVTAKFGKTLQNYFQISFYKSIPNRISLSSSTNTINVQGIGNEFAEITALVLDAKGDTIINGTDVTFQTTIGVFTNETKAQNVKTDNGKALIILKSQSEVGLAYITATSGSATTRPLPLVTIKKGFSPVDTIEISADTNNVTIVSGVERSFNITTIVKDSLGNKVADNTTIFFELSQNAPGIINQSVTTVDGIATATYTYFKKDEGTNVVVIARLRKQDGIEVTGSVQFKLPVR